ncbi:hypothetical protein [Palaeococcus ferrophilus]|uniref:hypothetical protein n=1 Tax=Palaeococcus ferrophilus TaxID=83868 RepID=UPI0012F75CC7|nr:hypothetical protein [Palaeococcus ferrophilus]
MGRPEEVLPFLRGRLLRNANGSREKAERVLDSLKDFYEDVSASGKVRREHLLLLEAYEASIRKLIEG